ncbi:MAG: 4Fe-4S ferredoxin, partial [Desulfobacteraceae bacterium]|nr:4Fe-4S ferredoxin [Desulfobacteraceae bacterium]
MAQTNCPVRNTIMALCQTILSGRLTDPKGRRILEQILKLIEEIAEGAAGLDHLCAIDSLIEEYFQNGCNDQNIETGVFLKKALEDNREIFQSHIESKNCPS